MADIGSFDGYTLEELIDDVEIVEFVNAKGSMLDSFKTEFQEYIKSIETIAAVNQGKEREIDIMRNTYNGVLEQKNHVARNVDEVIGQQEVLKEKIDTIVASQDHYRSKGLTQNEEISTYSGYFAELKEALAVGVDWSPEQVCLMDNQSINISPSIWGTQELV